MSQEGVRIIVLLIASFVAFFAIALFISDSSLAPLGSGKAVAFTMSPPSSPSTEGSPGSGGDSGDAGDSGDSGSSSPSEMEGAGAGEGTESSGEDGGDLADFVTVDKPTPDDSNSQTSTDSGGGGGGSRRGSEETVREEDNPEEPSEGPVVEQPAEVATPSFPESFNSEEDFIDSFVTVAETTIAQDFGIKNAEVREVIRAEDDSVEEVVVEGVSEGYLFGFIPVRSPKTIVVSHIEDQAYVRKVSQPWWAWLVRFVQD